jgi:hypothetical protein
MSIPLVRSLKQLDGVLEDNRGSAGHRACSRCLEKDLVP